MREVDFMPQAAGELGRLRAFDRSEVAEAIRKNLFHEPATPTRNRKVLVGLEPPFEAVLPLLELRVGDYRVFCDVDMGNKRVCVRAIRRKPPHKTTEEIL